MNHTHLILLLTLVAVLALSGISNFRRIQESVLHLRGRDNNVLVTGQKRRLADGCYHVFLDVGANIGVHGRFLMEPEKYPKTRNAHIHFNNEFGEKRDNRDLCVFAFEPNPAHRQRLEQLQAAYQAMGWRYHAIPAAVGDMNGNKTFKHMNDEKYGEWGFTSVREKGDGDSEARAEVVPVVRLATWLLEEINDRAIPGKTYGTYDTGPKVIMKFDVEGMEFTILPDLILSGALCQTVDFVFGEFHYQDFFYPMEFKENKLYFKDSKEARNYADITMKLIEVNNACRTRYNRGPDDESYLKDGMPLPVRNQTTLE